MSAVITVDFANEQVTNLKALLAANLAARLAAQGTQSYSLETGQTRQSVTKALLVHLAQERQVILNELQYWESQLCGTGVLHGKPSW